MSYTYQDVLDAVFYAQQKPEVLAAIVCKALGVTVPETPVFRTPVTEKTTEGGTPSAENT